MSLTCSSSLAARLTRVAVSVSLGLASWAAHATLFDPGDSALVTPENFPGLVVADVLRPFTIDFGGGLSLNGTVQDRVVKLADGTLSFELAIRDIGGAVGSRITGWSRGSFGAGTLNVTYDPTTSPSIGTVAPSVGQRSADGKSLRLDYDPGFGNLSRPSSGARFVDIRTGDTAYAAIGDLAILALGPNNQFGSTKLTVFAPVPEPSSVVLMVGGGLAVIAAVARRRRG